MSLKDRTRRYKKKIRDHWRKFGNCIRCGEPTNINKRTGKPYSECFKHRLRSAKRMKKVMRKRRKSNGRNTREIEIRKSNNDSVPEFQSGI